MSSPTRPPGTGPGTRPAGSPPPERWSANWTGPAAGEHYQTGRWTSRRKRTRDPRLVAALLRSVSLGPGSRLRILDAPCGTGRLENGLLAFGDVTGLDVSRAMLATDHTHRGAARVCADVRRMPFADGTFDAVVCCRLLHHLPTEDVVASVLAELVRVSRDLVVVSFWDSGSLAAWRRRIWPGARPPRRLARSRDTIAALLERAGARVLEWRHSLRFVSRQTFVLARKRTLP